VFPNPGVSDAMIACWATHGGDSQDCIEWPREMHGHRAIAFLIAIAFIGAVFTPCRPLISVSVHGAYEASGESGHPDGGFDPISSGVASDKGARSNHLALKARCPCGCDERPPVAGSSPGLGVALIAHVPSPVPPRGDQQCGSLASSLPAAPLDSIDAVPRAA
jgi:hypothetical protein